MVKAGDGLAVFVPDSAERAVEHRGVRRGVTAAPSGDLRIGSLVGKSPGPSSSSPIAAPASVESRASAGRASVAHAAGPTPINTERMRGRMGSFTSMERGSVSSVEQTLRVPRRVTAARSESPR